MVSLREINNYYVAKYNGKYYLYFEDINSAMFDEGDYDKLHNISISIKEDGVFTTLYTPMEEIINALSKRINNMMNGKIDEYEHTMIKMTYNYLGTMLDIICEMEVEINRGN